jgi:hypothetical protein
MDAKEPYVAGGWKLKDPASAPGVLEYRGGVTIADLRGDHDYGPLLAGKDDFEAFRLLLESIHGTEAERQNLERQPGASMSARREKKWHLVDALPWCDEHDRPLHLREGTGPYGGYAFYSCPASLGGGAYCPVKVNARDLREAL